MKKSIKWFVIAATLVLTLGTDEAIAQCVENLRRARTVYDEGRLHEIYDVLKDCLDGDDLNDEEKTEAYRLIILSYIYQDQPEEADLAMLDLLKANPLYVVPPSDPNELISLYATFRTDPIYRVGFSLAGNYSMVNVIETYGVAPSDNSNGNFSGNFGFNVGLFIERDFFKKQITFRGEVIYSSYKTTYSATAFPLEVDPSISLAEYTNVETQNWIGLNFLARYAIFKESNFSGKINPHLILGPSFQSLLNSNSANFTDIRDGESATGADLIYNEQGIRRSINISAVAGVGFVFPFGKSSLIAELTYQYGLTNITDAHGSAELNWKYGAGMSDISISTINFSLGMMLNHYSPKKMTY